MSTVRRTTRRRALIGLGALAIGAGALGGVSWWLFFAGRLNPALAYRGHASRVWGVAWSPDGQRLISADCGGAMHIWSAASGKLMETHHLVSKGEWPQYPFRPQIAWSPPGDRVAVAPDLDVRIWDLASARQTLVTEPYATEPYSKQVWALAWSPDGKSIVSGSGYGSAAVWSSTNGAVVSSAPAERVDAWVNDLAWSPDGSRVALAYYRSRGGEPAPVYVWDPTTGRELTTYYGHQDAAEDPRLAWSPDGRCIASVSVYPHGAADIIRNLAWVWDAATGKTIVTCEVQSDGVIGVTWSPDGSRVLMLARDQVLVWDVTNGGRVTSWQLSNQLDGPTSWSPDRRRFAAIPDSHDAVLVWEMP